ncbi:MAG: hypothetical protein LBS90_05790 [Oscillospiraceae bacterium]|jgi:hypothetical protein|nr:hypothetical protein [Oscillospiraceae bacterium]
MKNERIHSSWDKIEPGDAARRLMLENILARTRPGENRKVTSMKTVFNRKRIAALAACACLVAAAAVAIPLINGGGTADSGFPLARSDDGVKASYVDDLPDIPKAANSLIALTEEELFSFFNPDIFSGTVERIRNIKLDFGDGSDHYRAIAKISVEKVWRGDLAAGDSVFVLLPCPIDDGGLRVSDTEVIANLREGMRGIFMPMKYDETSYWQQSGVTLSLLDVAQYGLADGLRFAFLETDGGLVFDRDAYASVGGADSLGEIGLYIEAMLAK